MFFRKKDRDAVADASANTGRSPKSKDKAVAGTAPDLVEAPAAAEATETVSAAADETVGASVVAPSAGGQDVVAADDDAIRLFPGFERDDFEVGFRADRGMPALVMRWKDGGDWFVVPALFNRGVLAAMDERESSSDLNRLLRNYGYDVETD